MAKQTLSANEARAFLVAAIVIPLAIWPIAFNFGAYGVLFFRDFYKIWILTLAAFFAHAFILPRVQVRKENEWRMLWSWIAVISSTLVVVSWINVLDMPAWMSAIAEVLVLLYTIPYVALVLIYVSNPEMLRLKRWDVLIALFAIIGLITLIGFLVGLYHPYFLVCEEFTISGEFVPTNCTPAKDIDLEFDLTD